MEGKSRGIATNVHCGQPDLLKKQPAVFPLGVKLSNSHEKVSLISYLVAKGLTY